MKVEPGYSRIATCTVIISICCITGAKLLMLPILQNCSLIKLMYLTWLGRKLKQKQNFALCNNYDSRWMCQIGAQVAPSHSSSFYGTTFNMHFRL
jgi:hypothetical protein